MNAIYFLNYKADYNMRINTWYISSFVISLVVAIPILTVFTSFLKILLIIMKLLKTHF